MDSEHSLSRRMKVIYWGIPLILACTLVGGLLFLAFILVVHGLIVREFFALAEKKGYPGNPTIPLILGSLLMISLFVQWWWSIPLLAAILLLTEVFRKDNLPFQRLGLYALSWVYISLFLSSLVLIRQHGGPRYLDGAVWILLMLSTIWICDTAAYWGGSKWGEAHLHFKASPNKTVEGFIIGAAAGLIWAMIWTQLPGIRYTIADGFTLGIIVGIVGQAGDLVESMYKRSAEVKDTSNFLKGHGGVLDRFDSMLFSSPVLLAYIYASGIWV
jgi:phosphatidate cytidylyltransferase